MPVIIGFGFGSPLVSLLMLVATGSLSYLIYRLVNRGRSTRTPNQPTRAELRAWYYEQRRRARHLSQEFDLTDDEIERRIDEQIGPHGRDS